MRGKLILLGLFIFLFWGNLFPSAAQDDTFGPICDENISCTPTQPPPTETPTEIPTSTPIPTDTPTPTTALGGPEEATPTPIPTEMPRAGSIEVVSIFLLSSVILISLGLFGRLLFIHHP